MSKAYERMNVFTTSFAIGLFLVFAMVPPEHSVAGAEEPPKNGLPADKVEFFETRIRPLLVKHCYECHSSAASEIKGGLKLDYREGVLKGGDSGAAIVPGKPDDSLLLDALRFGSLEMPPAGKLPDGVIADIEQWIRDGAADPRDRPPTAEESAAESWKLQLAERSHWWSLQPPRIVSPPEVTDADWSQEPVDRFIRASLDQSGLSPARPAEPEVLLRRLAFVLTGLPPEAEQVGTFPRAYALDSDRALSAAVDQLLSSPHFGERIARHWMDVVRYTDTYGYEWDISAKGSWEYRDYLIRAFNNDVGFDQLIREQVAGDLLDSPRINREDGLNESMIGPMFYHMGEHRHGSSLAFNGIHQDMVNNKIDAFSKAFLAMTVACARCHDHKLDAISQADYYALAGVFMTPRWTARSIDAPGKHDAQVAQLKQLRSEIRSQLAETWTSHGGPLASGADLLTWATENRTDLKAAGLDNVAWPLTRLLPEASANASGPRSDESGSDTWSQLAMEWKSTRSARLKANESFETLTDFTEPGFPAGWVTEGDGIRHGYVTAGTPRISLEGEQLVSEVLDSGYHTHALSPKLPGAVRLPAPELFPRARVTMRMAGGQWSGRRDIPQNAFLNEGPVFFDPAAAPAWTGIAKAGLTNGVTRVLTEVSTSSLNSNFPPRTGVARSGKVTLPNNDEGHDKRSWFSVTGIVTNDGGGGPAATLNEFTSLYEGEEPASTEQCWQRLRDWLVGAIDRWTAGESEPGDVKLVNWLLVKKLVPNDVGSVPNSADLLNRYREIEATIAFPRTANSMDERAVRPVDYRLNPRGDVYQQGPAIRRDFLEVFHGKHGVDTASGSGRLELARYLSSRENPQTARVFVNRIWQWVFGTGIVATPSDFGKLGDHPSHPELLDWLAIQFMEEGWSTQKLVRRLVLSQTFRQSGDTSQTGLDRDPRNRLLHHYPLRRLEAEAIRDSLLAVSGTLDAKLYGRPINPPRGVEDAKKRLFSGPLDSHGRRSLYIEMSIMEPPKFLVGFNLPDMKLPTGRRDETNVPAQALLMLNDPFVILQSERWADELVADDSADSKRRIQRMFMKALGRSPDQAELERWTSAVGSFAQSDDVMTDQAAWAELAHTLFNTKEFIYYR